MNTRQEDMKERGKNMKIKNKKAFIYKENDNCRVPVMNCSQDCVEIDAIAEDGIFRIQDGLFSKVYGFSNINYDILSDTDQSKIVVKYMKLLQNLNARFKLTYINDDIDYEEFRKNIMLPYKKDGYDNWRKVLNDINENRMREGKQGVESVFYFTVSVKRKTYEEAKNYFITLEKSMQNDLHRLGSALTILNCEQRMKILYEFYHYGDMPKAPFRFDFDAMVENARDFIDDIAPARIKFHEDYFELNSVLGRILYVRSFPTDLTDRFVQKLLDLPYHILISVDAEPVDRVATMDLLNEKYMDVQEKIRKQQEIRNKRNEYSSEISKPVQDEKEAVDEMIDAVKSGNMSMFYCGVTIAVFASDREEMEERTEAIYNAAIGETVLLDIAYQKQREGINTILPIGIRQSYKMRTMLSGAMTAFLPFTTQELMIPGGDCYGINQLSKNIVNGDRRTLRNGNAWVFGTPGSGKSMDVKLEKLILALRNGQDEFIIIDPNNEYGQFAELLNGVYIDVRPGSKMHINGFAFPEEMPKEEIVPSKTAWMISVHVQCRQGNLSAEEKSLVDEALNTLYQPWINGIKSASCPPDMLQYRQILLDMDSELSQGLAKELAYFTKGSLNMFAQQTNVDIQNRVVVYGIRDISKELLPVAISIIMESLRSRVYENYKKGIATWIDIDEAHRLTKDDLSAEYLDLIWREFRKFYGFCTGISHQVSDVCRSEKSKELVRNSAFLWMFGQEDITPLRELEIFTEEQLAYVMDAEPGTGLLKHGKTIIPVDNRIPVDSELYQILNTDPNKNAKK